MKQPLQSLRAFSDLPLETRLRRTCTGCGQPFVASVEEALAFVTGPPEQHIECPLCGWRGTK
jgi:hypothetical protein